MVTSKRVGTRWGRSLARFAPAIMGKRYFRKVLATAPIGYWPLWEAAGGQAADISGNDLHGSYTGVTLGQPGIGDGHTCPLFDGANDYIDLLSAGLTSAFDGAEGSLMIWGKVFNAGVWTDTTDRKICRIRAASDNNQIMLDKKIATAGLKYLYRAGGTTSDGNVGYSDVGWFHITLTWSVIADEVIYYLNGVAIETKTILGTFAGSIDRALLGASYATGVVWYGYLAHCAMWDSPIDAPTVAALAVR